MTTVETTRLGGSASDIVVAKVAVSSHIVLLVYLHAGVLIMFNQPHISMVL